MESGTVIVYGVNAVSNKYVSSFVCMPKMAIVSEYLIVIGS